MGCANDSGRSGDTTPGTSAAKPMKRKLCRMSRGCNASLRGRTRSLGQMYRAATTPQAMRPNAMLTKNQIICCGMMNVSFAVFRLLTRLSRGGESLLGPWTDEHSERGQRANGNVLVIHQVFPGERQGFHDGPCLVLGFCVDQHDDAFAIAAWVPLAHLAVE